MKRIRRLIRAWSSEPNIIRLKVPPMDPAALGREVEQALTRLKRQRGNRPFTFE